MIDKGYSVCMKSISRYDMRNNTQNHKYSIFLAYGGREVCIFWKSEGQDKVDKELVNNTMNRWVKFMQRWMILIDRYDIALHNLERYTAQAEGFYKDRITEISNELNILDSWLNDMATDCDEAYELLTEFKHYTNNQKDIY